MLKLQIKQGKADASLVRAMSLDFITLWLPIALLVTDTWLTSSAYYYLAGYMTVRILMGSFLYFAAQYILRNEDIKMMKIKGISTKFTIYLAVSTFLEVFALYTSGFIGFTVMHMVGFFIFVNIYDAVLARMREV